MLAQCAEGYPYIAQSNKVCKIQQSKSVLFQSGITNYQKGLNGEFAAISMLKKQNMQLVGHRIKNKYGEIDILTYKDGTYYIVEVKNRKNFSKESITKRNLQRSLNAFFMYAQQKEINYEKIGVKAIVRNVNSMEIIDIDYFDLIN